MCYNCGCGDPDDDHRKGHAGVDQEGKAITNRSFESAANAFDMDAKEAKQNAHDLLMSADK